MIKNTWRAMQDRCRYPSNPRWHLYGGAGVTVCERWKVFANFVADMGLPPNGKMQIDRIDPARGYEPSNCRWVTSSQNNANRRSWGKSGLRGVYLRPSGRFVASLGVGGKTLTLGTFDTKEEAAAVVDAALVRRFGDHAMTNARERR